MPYYLPAPQPVLDLGKLAGLASAYFNIKDQLAEQKMRQQQEQQDIASSKTQQAATRVQYGLGPNDEAPQTNLASPFDTIPTATGAALSNLGTSGQEAAKIGAPKPSSAPSSAPQNLKGPLAGLKPGSPEYDLAVADFYNKQAATAGSGYERSAYEELAKQWTDEATTASWLPGREAEGPLKGAETGYYGARTKLTAAQTNNTIRLFDHQIKMLGMKISSADYIAAHRALTASGNADARAYQRALLDIGNDQVRAMVEDTDRQNTENMDVWRTQNELAPAGTPVTAPPASATIRVQFQQLPNGQVMPHAVKEYMINGRAMPVGTTGKAKDGSTWQLQDNGQLIIIKAGPADTTKNIRKYMNEAPPQ